MSYISKDEQILGKIERYIIALADIYKDVKNLNDDELEYNRDAFAMMQCITNIYEVFKHIDNDQVGDKLNVLSSRHISKLRNISAHEYSAINWKIAKEVCEKILNQVTKDKLDSCMDIIKSELNGIKDYAL